MASIKISPFLTFNHTNYTLGLLKALVTMATISQEVMEIRDTSAKDMSFQQASYQQGGVAALADRSGCETPTDRMQSETNRIDILSSGTNRSQLGKRNIICKNAWDLLADKLHFGHALQIWGR